MPPQVAPPRPERAGPVCPDGDCFHGADAPEEVPPLSPPGPQPLRLTVDPVPLTDLQSNERASDEPTPEIVDEEEGLLARVRAHLATVRPSLPPPTADYEGPGICFGGGDECGQLSDGRIGRGAGHNFWTASEREPDRHFGGKRDAAAGHAGEHECDGERDGGPYAGGGEREWAGAVERADPVGSGGAEPSIGGDQ